MCLRLIQEAVAEKTTRGRMSFIGVQNGLIRPNYFSTCSNPLEKFFVAFSAFFQGDMLRGNFPRNTKLILHLLALFVNVDYYE